MEVVGEKGWGPSWGVLLYVLYYTNFWDKTHKYLDVLNEIYAIFIGIVLMYY